MKITLCATCALGQGGFADTLHNALTQRGIHAEIASTDCLSGCTRPSALAFRAPGKMAYLFGDLIADDLPGLMAFAALYAASPDGRLADARPLGTLRHKAIARIPG